MSRQDDLERHADAEETGYARTPATASEAPPRVLPDPAIQPHRPGEPPQIEPEPPDPGEPWTDPQPPTPPDPAEPWTGPAQPEPPGEPWMPEPRER